MKALTVCQPWAWMIVHGHKLIENRTWRWGAGETRRLLIHAGKSRAWIHACDDPELYLRIRSLPAPEELVFGAIVGAVDVVDYCGPDDPRVVDDPFAQGPCCWILENPEVFAVPIPFRGRQRIFDVPAAELPGLEADRRKAVAR